MVVEIGKVLGRLADGWWAQVYDHAADPSTSHSTVSSDRIGSGQLSHRGRLIAGISLELASAGREALVRLHELYFGNLEGDPLVALKRAGMVIAQEFPGIELASLAIVSDAVYVVVVGGAGVWSKIEGQEGWIVKPNPKITAMSGWVKPGQIFVAGNSKFWQVLSLGAVRAAVANGIGAADIAESLAAVVAGNDIGVGGVGVVIKILSPKNEVPNKIKMPNFISKLRNILPKPVGPIYVSHSDKTVSRRRNMNIGVGFLVLLLLLVSGWQWRKTYLEKKQSKQNQQIEQLVHKFNEAQALTQLNPVRSRQLLGEVGEEIKKLSELSKGRKDERIRQIEADFGQVLGVASGVKQATADEILDLDWLRSGMKGSKLALVEKKLVVLDSEVDRLAIVDPAKKSGEIVAGKTDLGETKFMAVYPGKIVVLSDKGIVECSVIGVQCSVKIPLNKEWGEVKDMKMFAGNIYLLTQSDILRYQVTDGGYGGKQKWLADTEISQGQSMAIDSFIWVGTTDGQILKFARGAKENFAVTDLDKPFGKKTVVYTDSDTEKLYVLDPSNGRVVVLEKTGAYKFQYQFDQTKEAIDFVVDEKGGQMYLLEGSKIMGVKL